MAQLTIRIEEDLKDQLDHLARQEGKTTSDVVRQLVKSYVRDRDRSVFLESLWQRMQANAEAAGMSKGDVARAIDKVRQKPDG